MQVVECEETIRQLRAELQEADDRYNSANKRITNLQQLQADIEQANIKVTVCFMLPSLEAVNFVHFCRQKDTSDLAMKHHFSSVAFVARCQKF